MHLEKAYQEHNVFQQLSGYADFYKSLSFSVLGFITPGIKAFPNVDSYVYSSIQGTIESMRHVLVNGRIGDAYTLLRKYYDSAIINVYLNLYIKENFNLDTFIVKQIDDWVQGKERLPEYRVISSYIRKSKHLTKINALLLTDATYKDIRNRCNDHTHYNFYHNVIVNDNEVYLKGRLGSLDRFSKDMENVFILHFAYLFQINGHYMTASDYLDSLECGLTPEEGSQYLVAPFIQEVFNSIVKKNRADIAKELMDTTCMKLE
ncbi:MAG TPA: hypothetical protein DER10_01775 [Elusimicrobia bacterium]|nr:hypothetical protein [Elusimicrobiota bacterium]